MSSCHNTRTSKSNKISLHIGDSTIHTFSCGRCTSCLSSKRKELFMRCMLEYKYILSLKNNSYLLFQSLTYPLSKVPMDNGVKVHDLEHIKKFRRLLINYLVKCGYDARNGKVKMFIVSEYGHENQYTDSKGNVRVGLKMPHYHLVMSCSNPEITPEILDRAIKMIWKTKGRLPNQKGRGKKFNGLGFGHTDITPLNSRIVNGQSVFEYLVKYVTKDSLKSENYELIREKNHLPFYSMSAHFGDHLTDQMKEQVDVDGYLKLDDSFKVTKKYSLPMYYQRKLYYNCVKEGKKIRWELNKKGYNWKMKHLDNRLSIAHSDLHNQYINLNPEQKKIVDNILDGRTLLDLAKYNMIYRWRLVDLKMKKNLPDYKEFYEMTLSGDTKYHRNVTINGSEYVTKIDENDFDSFFGQNHGKDVTRLTRITQSMPQFFMFDDLNDYLSGIRYIHWSGTERNKLDKMRLAEKYKNIGIKTFISM